MEMMDDTNKPIGNFVIEAKEIHVTFSNRKQGETGLVRAVDGISLGILPGEILAVVGESGCGKTTFGKAILNIVKPSSGNILYRGQELTGLSGKELSRLRQKLQLIFQDPYEALDPRQNVYKTLLEPLTIHRKEMNEEEKREKIYRYLEDVGLHPAKEMAGRYPHHLSGGQRQRLSIASAMILEPDFVVADEPVSMLDVSVRAEILKLMLDLQKSKNLTYLFITHDLSLAWMIAHRIAVFYLGKMVELGPAAAVVHAGAHPYTQALVSVIPAMDEADKAPVQHVLTGETPSPKKIPPGCRFHTRCWRYQQEGEPEICRRKEPEFVSVGEGHQAACHFGKEK